MFEGQTTQERESESPENTDAVLLASPSFIIWGEFFFHCGFDFFFKHAAAAGVVVAPADFTPRTGKTHPFPSHLLPCVLNLKKKRERDFAHVNICSQAGTAGRCDVPQLETFHSPCTSWAACTASSCPHDSSSVGTTNCRCVPKVMECKV